MTDCQSGKWLADSSERLLEAINHHAIMCGADGQQHDPDDIVDAEIAVSECSNAVKERIYEFRKRHP